MVTPTRLPAVLPPAEGCVLSAVFSAEPQAVALIARPAARATLSSFLRFMCTSGWDGMSGIENVTGHSHLSSFSCGPGHPNGGADRISRLGLSPACSRDRAVTYLPEPVHDGSVSEL